MLLEIPYKNGDVITIKTIAGDEIIAVLEKEDNHHLTIKKPMAIMPSGQGLGLGPWTFTVNPDAKLDLNKNTIVFFVKSDEEMAKQYLTNTTGISV